MSRITRKQIQVVQIARRQLGLDDDDYRAILREIGRVESSTQLTQRGFEDVLAHFEHRGFNRTCGQQQGSERFARDHFRQRKWERGIFASAREVHLIRELIQQVGYKLPGLCLRFSDGRVDDPARLNPREAHNLIEMLKSKQAATVSGGAQHRDDSDSPRAAQGGAVRNVKDDAGVDAGSAGVAPRATPRTGDTHDTGPSTGWGESQPDEDCPF